MPGSVPTISIETRPGGQLFAAEAGLPTGSAPGQAATSSSTAFTIQALDGVRSLSVAGYQAISDGVFTAGSADLGYGVITVTDYDPASGQVAVSFTLTAASDSFPGPTQRYGDLYDVPVVLTNANGDAATGALTLQVRDDDRVQANDDAAHATAGGPAATGDLTSNDLFSADGFGGIFRIASPDTGQTLDLPAGGAVAVQGLHGVLTLDADGTFSYAASAGAADGSTDLFRYWTRDGDGDQAQATLAVTVTPPAAAADMDPPDGGEFPVAFDLFRNGAHPSLKAGDKAWEQYDLQAAKQGYDLAVGRVGAHTLWGKAEPIVTFADHSGLGAVNSFEIAAFSHELMAGFQQGGGGSLFSADWFG